MSPPELFETGITKALAIKDVEACDREPIHTPGSIQPFGMLFSLDESSRIVRQISENAGALLGKSNRQLLGSSLDDLLGVEFARLLASTLTERAGIHALRSIAIEGNHYQAIAHRHKDRIILELEQTEPPNANPNPYASVNDFVTRASAAQTEYDASQLAAEIVRAITGFDRVLVYKFDADWHGRVVAEDRNEQLPAYLDLRFPASDIPKQARELYRLNRIRLIPDVNYEPARLLRDPGDSDTEQLDLTYSVLRSVSPVHVEYMKNMQTASSMSFSILRDGELWGLMSCHHKTPRKCDFQGRATCDVICQILSMQLAAIEQSAHDRESARLSELRQELLERLSKGAEFVDSLAENSALLLAVTNAQGAAIFHQDGFRLIGETPSESEVRKLSVWLGSQHQEVFSTDCLASLYPVAADYAGTASGVLAIRISEFHNSYIIWFRPEIIKTVLWGGDPTKPHTQTHLQNHVQNHEERLHPRNSFEAWQAKVGMTSRPWSASAAGSARALRSAVVEIVLRRAEERALLSSELEHSNRELEAFSYSVSHDLRAPFRHIVGYSELLREDPSNNLSEKGIRYIETVVQSAEFAGRLVDNLLHFSRVGRTALERKNVDMNALVREAMSGLDAELMHRNIQWKIDPLPILYGDQMMLYLVLINLLSNAVKYTRIRTEACIEIGSETKPREHILWVRDNGIGFDMAFADKLFGVFQRLHRMEDYEGTGIGLANVRRIVSRHGGRTWAEGTVDQGAAFYFSFPRNE